jgi:hypothetical protein
MIFNKVIKIQSLTNDLIKAYIDQYELDKS